MENDRVVFTIENMCTSLNRLGLYNYGVCLQLCKKYKGY